MRHLQCRPTESEFITLHEQKSSEEEVVQDISALIVALGVTPWLPVVAQSAEQAAQSEENGDAAKVSGSRGEPRHYAVCVNPRWRPGRSNAGLSPSALQAPCAL